MGMIKAARIAREARAKMTPEERIRDIHEGALMQLETELLESYEELIRGQGAEAAEQLANELDGQTVEAHNAAYEYALSNIEDEKNES